MSKLTVVGKSSVVVGRWEDWREQWENQWRQLGLELIAMVGPDDEMVLKWHGWFRTDRQLKTIILQSNLSSDACSDISWQCDFWNANRLLWPCFFICRMWERIKSEDCWTYSPRRAPRKLWFTKEVLKRKPETKKVTWYASFHRADSKSRNQMILKKFLNLSDCHWLSWLSDLCPFH